MKHWLQSLSETGFDVFQVVWIGIAIYTTQFFLRLFLKKITKIITDHIDKKTQEIIEYFNYTVDEIEDR